MHLETLVHKKGISKASTYIENWQAILNRLCIQKQFKQNLLNTYGPASSLGFPLAIDNRIQWILAYLS